VDYFLAVHPFIDDWRILVIRSDPGVFGKRTGYHGVVGLMLCPQRGLLRGCGVTGKGNLTIPGTMQGMW
jgi:hypothetical protein